MAKRERVPLTQERLKDLLRYDPETGVFTWLQSAHNRHRWRIGTAAGTVPRKGYQDLRIEGQLYRAHRLAWFYMTGEWPVDQIDHIDMNRLNNRWENLRLATNQQNNVNRLKQSNNRSGYKGVSFCQFTGKWRATITFDGKQMTIGRFNTAEIAYAAYQAKARELFGEFAKTS